MQKRKVKRPTKLRVFISLTLSTLILCPLYVAFYGPAVASGQTIDLNYVGLVGTHIVVFGAFCFADRDQSKYRRSFANDSTPGHPLYDTFYRNDD